MIPAIPVLDLGIGDRFRVKFLNEKECFYVQETYASQERPQGVPQDGRIQQEDQRRS